MEHRWYLKEGQEGDHEGDHGESHERDREEGLAEGHGEGYEVGPEAECDRVAEAAWSMEEVLELS